MTDVAAPDPVLPQPTRPGIAHLRKRHRAETRYRAYGVVAIAAAAGALAILLVSVIGGGLSAFTEHRLTLNVYVDPLRVDPQQTGDPEVIARANVNGLLQNALRERFPEVSGRTDLRALFGLYSSINAPRLLTQLMEDPALIGQTVAFDMPLADVLDLYFKGRSTARTEVPGPGGAVLALSEDATAALTFEGAGLAGVVADLQATLGAQAEAFEARAASLRAIGVEGDDLAAASRRQELTRLTERAAAYRERAGVAGDLVPLGRDLPSVLLHINGGVIKATALAADLAEGTVILAPSEEGAARGDWRVVMLETPEADRRVLDSQIVWAEALREDGAIRATFNTTLFTRGDSREPELAGVLGAFVGSLLTMLVTMLLAVPVGVGASIYLEEFAPKNAFTQMIEVNINNLAAVPSIVFGLLGLAMFIGVFGMPRSAPLVGGMVLALMTLPTVIIATRAALKAVPASIREGALALGASPVQVVFHHVLPLAAPGILTGSIIGLAQALGETAPLLMIGMVAFVVDVPTGFTQPATVMPVQIFLWSDSAERAFTARTAAAIMVLLSMMILMNLAAIVLRRRFERRW